MVSKTSLFGKNEDSFLSGFDTEKHTHHGCTRSQFFTIQTDPKPVKLFYFLLSSETNQKPTHWGWFYCQMLWILQGRWFSPCWWWITRAQSSSAQATFCAGEARMQIYMNPDS